MIRFIALFSFSILGRRALSKEAKTYLTHKTTVNTLSWFCGTRGSKKHVKCQVFSMRADLETQPCRPYFQTPTHNSATPLTSTLPYISVHRIPQSCISRVQTRHTHTQPCCTRPRSFHDTFTNPIKCCLLSSLYSRSHWPGFPFPSRTRHLGWVATFFAPPHKGHLAIVAGQYAIFQGSEHNRRRPAITLVYRFVSITLLDT